MNIQWLLVALFCLVAAIDAGNPADYESAVDHYGGPSHSAQSDEMPTQAPQQSWGKRMASKFGNAKDEFMESTVKAADRFEASADKMYHSVVNPIKQGWKHNVVNPIKHKFRKFVRKDETALQKVNNFAEDAAYTVKSSAIGKKVQNTWDNWTS